MIWSQSLFELSGDRYLAPMRKIRAFTRPIILDRINSIQPQDAAPMGEIEDEKTFSSQIAKEEEINKPCLLDSLIRTMKLDDGEPDVKGIEDELINILVAARDTVCFRFPVNIPYAHVSLSDSC